MNLDTSVQDDIVTYDGAFVTKYVPTVRASTTTIYNSDIGTPDPTVPGTTVPNNDRGGSSGEASEHHQQYEVDNAHSVHTTTEAADAGFNTSYANGAPLCTAGLNISTNDGNEEDGGLEHRESYDDADTVTGIQFEYGEQEYDGAVHKRSRFDCEVVETSRNNGETSNTCNCHDSV
uniref:Protein kinase PVPK-1 n=1 Tax=Lygus hesperus TaxID=30085 RepID=A0A0A9YZE5_LYGHE